jgi:hypothetical protein
LPEQVAVVATVNLVQFKHLVSSKVGAGGTPYNTSLNPDAGDKAACAG